MIRNLVILYLAFGLKLLLFAESQKAPSVQEEVLRFICPTKEDFQKDVEALKARLTRIRKKDYSVTVGDHGIWLKFQKTELTPMELTEITNTGQIEIVMPASPDDDPKVKNAYDMINKMNEQILQLNKQFDLSRLLWLKHNELKIPDDYETDIWEGDPGKDKFKIRQPLEILLFKRKHLIGPEHIENISFHQDNYDGRIKYGLGLKFNAEGKKIFADYTRSHKGSRLYLYLNDEFVAGPIIHEPIEGGEVVLSNAEFTREFALLIARLRRSELYRCKVNRT